MDFETLQLALGGLNNVKFLTFCENFNKKAAYQAKIDGTSTAAYPGSMIRRLFTLAGQRSYATGGAEEVTLPVREVADAVKSARRLLE